MYYAINRIFTLRTFQTIIKNKQPKVYYDIKKSYANTQKLSNLNFIKEMYKVLSMEYRNEYFYKNTILNKLLLGKHSINTTVALTEIPIDKSKADFILINGKAVVYEIKTDLDNFERLDSQIESYYRAFDHVCIVSSETNFNKLFEMYKDTPVGIYTLTKKNTISKRLIKEPIKNRLELDHTTIFKMLKKAEYEHIIKCFYNKLPDVKPIYMYTACFELFKKLEINAVYPKVLEVMKTRYTHSKGYLDEIPYELKFIGYFLNANKLQSSRLIDFLNKEI